jgi:hypothetical protein
MIPLIFWIEYLFMSIFLTGYLVLEYDEVEASDLENRFLHISKIVIYLVIPIILVFFSFIIV